MSIQADKLFRHAPADYWGAALAYLYLLRAGWHLFVRRGRVDRWALPGPRSTPATPPTSDERRVMLRRARWVNAAARYPWPWARCLQRSVALCLWLEQAGVIPELRIGVQREGAELQAHAWVEHQGVILNDRPQAVAQFAALDTGARLAGLPWAREVRLV